MKIGTFIGIILVGAFTGWSQTKSEKEKILAFEIEINAPVDSVWARWTTESGRKKFLAPSSKVELATLGYMEVLFNPTGPVGQKGSENNRVLAFRRTNSLALLGMHHLSSPMLEVSEPWLSCGSGNWMKRKRSSLHDKLDLDPGAIGI